jgi:hypothetical protein
MAGSLSPYEGALVMPDGAKAYQTYALQPTGRLFEANRISIATLLPVFCFNNHACSDRIEYDISR